MQHASVLGIDETSMGRKYIFECLYRSLQEVPRTKSFFGGVTVPAGDWRQISPVARHGTSEQTVASTLKNMSSSRRT